MASIKQLLIRKNGTSQGKGTEHRLEHGLKHVQRRLTVAYLIT